MEQPSIIVCKYFIRVVILCRTLHYTKKLQYPQDYNRLNFWCPENDQFVSEIHPVTAQH